MPDLNCKGPDLEKMLLAQRKDSWHLLDRAYKEGEKKGFTELEDVPDCQVYAPDHLVKKNLILCPRNQKRLSRLLCPTTGTRQ
jgi:hypothetical protein